MPSSDDARKTPCQKRKFKKVKVARSHFDLVECDAKSHTDFQETGVFCWHK